MVNKCLSKYQEEKEWEERWRDVSNETAEFDNLKRELSALKEEIVIKNEKIVDLEQ